MRMLNYSILGLILAIFCFHTSSGDGTGPCTWTAEDQSDKRSCRPGQAISHLTWKERTCAKLDLSIQCVNVTSSCHETCEWRPICSNSTPPYQYIRGIETFYDPGNQIHRAAFLCCTSKENTVKTCQSPFKHVQTEGSAAAGGSTKSNSTVFLKDAMSNNTSVYVQECKLERPVHQLCPISQIKTEEVPKNAYLYGLFGLAGLAGLAGLSGLALIKRNGKKCFLACSNSLTAADSIPVCDSFGGQFDTSYAAACTENCRSVTQFQNTWQGACCNYIFVGFCSP